MTDPTSLIDGKALWKRLEEKADSLHSSREEIDVGMIQGLYYAQECITRFMEGGSICKDEHDAVKGKVMTPSTSNEYEKEVTEQKREYRWQPIETAPKDGSWVRVGFAYVNPKTGVPQEEMILKFVKEKDLWISPSGSAHGIKKSVWTHWQKITLIEGGK